MLEKKEYDPKTEREQKQNNKPGCSELINGFPIAQITFYRVSQFTTLGPSTTAINNDNNVVETAGKVVVPVASKFEVD